MTAKHTRDANVRRDADPIRAARVIPWARTCDEANA
jgi:hypothetical protein